MTETMTVSRTRVVSVAQPCRGFRRIVLAGPDLERASEDLLGLLPPGVPDLHALYRGARPRRDAYVKVLVPPPGGASADPDLSKGFRTGFLALDEAERGWMRTYTVRSAGRVRLDGRHVPSLTIDVVLHGDPDDADDPHQGPGLRWARAVQAGDAVNVLVPTVQAPAWSAWRDTGARRVLAAGDETAVPALVSIAEELADPFGSFDGRADIVLELPHDGQTPDLIAQRLGVGEDLSGDAGGLTAHGPVRLHVLRRPASGARGETARARLAALLGVGSAVPPASPEAPADEPDTQERAWSLAAIEPDERPEAYAFLAGESSMVRALRRLCVGEGGIPKAHVSFMGYWKDGQAES